MCEYTVTIKVNSCANCPHSRYAYSTSPLLGKSGLYVINKQNTYTNITHLKKGEIYEMHDLW